MRWQSRFLYSTWRRILWFSLIFTTKRGWSFLESLCPFWYWLSAPIPSLAPSGSIPSRNGVHALRSLCSVAVCLLGHSSHFVCLYLETHPFVHSSPTHSQSVFPFEWPFGMRVFPRLRGSVSVVGYRGIFPSKADRQRFGEMDKGQTRPPFWFPVGSSHRGPPAVIAADCGHRILWGSKLCLHYLHPLIHALRDIQIAHIIPRHRAMDVYMDMVMVWHSHSFLFLFYFSFFSLSWVFYSDDSIHGDLFAHFSIFGEAWLWKFGIATLLPISIFMVSRIRGALFRSLRIRSAHILHETNPKSHQRWGATHCDLDARVCVQWEEGRVATNNSD